MNFLRNHGLRFHDGAHAATGGQIQNVTPRFLRVLGPEYLPAALLHVPLEFLEITIQMIHRLALDTLALLARRLPIEKPRSALANRGIVRINPTPQYLAMDQVGGLHRRAPQKILSSGHERPPALGASRSAPPVWARTLAR